MKDLQHKEFEVESLHPDDLAEVLLAGKVEIQELLDGKGIAIKQCSTKLKALGDINYPYTCYKVQGQTEWACKLTAPSDLPPEIRDIYKIDPGLTNVYARKDALLIGVQACVWSYNGKSGTATVSGMSSKRFDRTRDLVSRHNEGRAFDVKLHGRMMTDGSSYDQIACAYLCLYCVEAGATRVYFSDKAVVDAVNKATGKMVCKELGGHRNHIHMDNR